MVTEVSEASQPGLPPSLVALSALAAIAPFNVKLTAESWTLLELRLLVIVAFVIALVLTIRGLKTPHWHWPDRIDSLALGWCAMVWLSALVSDNVVFGSAGAVRLSVAALLIPATRSVVRTSTDARQVLQAVALGATVGALIGVVGWAAGFEANVMRVFAGDVTTLGPFNRLTRPWSHANVAAMALGASLASATLIRNTWLRFGSLALMTVALVLTISRGGLLAVGAAAVGWIVLRRDRVETVVVASLVVLGAVVFALSAAWTTRVDQLGDQAFFDSSLDVPASFVVDPAAGTEQGEDLVAVTITNDSITPWSKTGEDRVLISARWIGPDNLIWSEDWWELPEDLAPSESVIADLTVEARVPIGSYHVRWDLIVPETAYFGQFLGDEPIVSDAVVVSSLVSEADVFRYNLVERSINIGRVDTWRLAWKDFTSSPLLGVGPNQFGDQAGQGLETQQRAVGSHAHNVLLEPLATWGLLGTLPFLLLGGGAVLRAIRSAWRTRELVTTVIAVGLVAVITHGVVDWPLVTITNGIPVGLLVGLALADVHGSDRQVSST